MVRDTFQRVKHLINSLRQAGSIDEMTAKWFNQTPDPPRIPVFYTLTKIHKPTLSCLNRVLKPIPMDYQATPETLRI